MSTPPTPAADASGGKVGTVGTVGTAGATGAVGAVGAMGTTEAATPVPTITVHRGNATTEDVAVLTVIAAALGGGGDRAQRSSRTGWSSGARRLTQFAVRGSGWSRR